MSHPVNCQFCGPFNATAAADIADHARSREHLGKNAEALGLFVVRNSQAVVHGRTFDVIDVSPPDALGDSNAFLRPLTDEDAS